MNTPPSSQNITLYPWYAAAFNAHFWMPVFFLFFLGYMEVAEVLRLEAIYYVSVVLLEVPSGYFSDRYGRRLTLLIACSALIVAYAIFFVGAGFTAFAVAQVFLAAGLAFNSGTDTSLHFDSLAAVGREREFDGREAAVSRNTMLASGVAALIGGAVGVLDLRYAYLLSGSAALVSLILVVMMREPPSHKKLLVPIGPIRQIKTCGRLMRQPIMAWLFAFFVLMTILNHVPYEFYQPYIALALNERWALGEGTPLGTGIHVGVAMVIAAWFAARSIRFRNRLGLGGVLLSAAGLQTVIIAVMGLVLHPLVIVLILLRSVPRALMAAPLNAAIAPRVDRAQRATFLSVQSLAGRLAFSGFLVVLSLVPTETNGERWEVMSNQLLITSAVGLAGSLALASCVRIGLRSESAIE